MPTIYDDPGTHPVTGEGYVSQSWSATVGGNPAFVLGKTRDLVIRRPNWWTRSTLEASVLRFAETTPGETVTVVLTRAGLTITDLAKVHFYPKELRPADLALSGGGVSFTAREGDQFMVLYDDRAVDQNASSETVGALTLTAHMPPLFFQFLSAQVAPTGTIVDWDGSQTTVPDGTTLRFPVDGTVTDLPEQGLDIEAGGRVYIPGGKMVRGRIRALGSNVRVHGHGFQNGDRVRWEDLVPLPFEDRLDHSMFRVTVAATNVAFDGVCVLASPFYNLVGAKGGAEFLLVNVWTPNSDGILPNGDSTGTPWLFERFMAVVSDDCLHGAVWHGRGTYRNFVAASTAGATFLGGYWPYVREAAQPCRWELWHAIAIQTYEQGPIDASPFGYRFGEILKAWTDGATGQEAYAIADILLGDGRVDGDVDGNIRAKPWSLHSFGYPWSELDEDGNWVPGVAQQLGNIFNVELSRIRFESVPRDASGAIIRADIIGRDLDNTPHDLVFREVYFGSVLLTEANWSTYVNQGPTVYGVTIGTQSGGGSGGTGGTGGGGGTSGGPVSGGVGGKTISTVLVVEDGIGRSNAECFCSLEYLDAFWHRNGAPAHVTGATPAQKADAIRRANREWTEGVCSGKWRGIIQHRHQRLSWPRLGAHDDEGRLILPGTIPWQIVDAEAIVTGYLLGGGSILVAGLERAAVLRETKKGVTFEKTVEYADTGQSAASTVPRIRAAEALVFPLVRGNDVGVSRS